MLEKDSQPNRENGRKAGQGAFLSGTNDLAAQTAWNQWVENRSRPVKLGQGDFCKRLNMKMLGFWWKVLNWRKNGFWLECRDGIVCLSKVRLTHRFLAPAIVASWLAVPFTVRAGDDGIRTYIVPKERPATVQPANMSAMQDADIPTSTAHATWTTPTTWQQVTPTNKLRLAEFAIPGQDGAKAEAAVYSFRGSVGSELDNVNRWRGEVQLPPTTDDKIVSEQVQIGLLEGKLYEIPGASNSIVVASLSREGDTWIFKMWGDKDVVTDAVPVFRDFLKSVQFTDAVAAASVTPAAPAVLPPTAEAADNSSGEPKWSVPADWSEKEPGPMVFKSFMATDAQGKTAAITVSFLGGEGGGLFANVNRWRGQLGLDPVDPDKLDSVTQHLDTTAGAATLVDFTGTDAKTSQPARLIAVVVPHGDSTWFFKLMGDGGTVAAQKENFVKFVQTVQYP